MIQSFFLNEPRSNWEKSHFNFKIWNGKSPRLRKNQKIQFYWLVGHCVWPSHGLCPAWKMHVRAEGKIILLCQIRTNLSVGSKWFSLHTVQPLSRYSTLLLSTLKTQKYAGKVSAPIDTLTFSTFSTALLLSISPFIIENISDQRGLPNVNLYRFQQNL